MLVVNSLAQLSNTLYRQNNLNRSKEKRSIPFLLSIGGNHSMGWGNIKYFLYVFTFALT